MAELPPGSTQDDTHGVDSPAPEPASSAAADRAATLLQYALAAEQAGRERAAESERRFRSTADAATVLIWRSDRHGAGTWFNRAWLEFTGRTLQEELGFGWLDNVHPDDLARVHAHVAAAIVNRVPFEAEYRVRRRDGAWRWLRDYGVPRFDEYGDFVGFIGSCSDETDRKIARYRTEVLQQLSAELTRSLTRDEVTDVVVRHVSEGLGTYACGVVEFTPDLREFRLLGTTGHPKAVLERFARFPVDTPFPIRDVVRTREAIFVDSLAAWQRSYEGTPDLPPGVTDGRWAALPLIVDDRLLGALTLNFAGARQVSENERRFKRTFADLCAQALERARLFEAEREARQRSERLQELTAALVRLRTVEEIGAFCSRELCAIVGADMCWAGVVSEDDSELQSIGWHGMHEQLVQRWIRFPLDAPVPIAAALRDGAIQWWPDRTAMREAFPQYANVDDLDREAAVLVPLLIGRGASARRVGALSLGFRTPREFDPGMRSFVTALADLCAQALERARLERAERLARRASERRLDFATRLLRVTGALSQALTPQAVADVVLAEGASAVGAASGSVSLVDADGDTARTVAFVGWNRAHLWEAYSLSASGSPGLDAVRTREPVYLVDAEAWAARYPRAAGAAQAVGIAASVALPIVFDGRTQGLIGFSWREPHDPSPDERSLLEALSAQCAQALERARLFDAERTAREEAEQERMRLQRVLDRLPVGVIVVDREGVVVRYNAALETVLGHPVIDVGGVSDYAAYGALHADDRPYDAADYPIARALLHGETVIRELTRYRRGDGSVVTLSISAAPVPTDDGTIDYAVAALEDVHERETARAEAVAANRAKSDFLTVMSHELRTPLNAIAGHVQLVEMGIYGPVTEAQLDALNRVQQAQAHLLSLINDVLNFARLEAGKVEYDLRALPAAEVVRDVAAILEPQVQAKGLVLTLVLTDATPGETPADIVWADRDKLRQALFNLLANAIKFTPAQQPDGAPGQVIVELASRVDAPEFVFVRISDTGIGIPADRQQAIFDPFVQVRSGLTRVHEGTGLGLAISRDLARGMGGDLRVRSVEGEGATFTLTLRRAAADAPRDA